jgi:hypothetical protein
MYRGRGGIRESVVDSGNIFNIPEINTLFLSVYYRSFPPRGAVAQRRP